MNYILNKLLRCELTDEGLVLGTPGKDFIMISDGIDEYLTFLNAFKDPTDYETAYDIVNQQNYVTPKQFDEIMDFSKENNIVKIAEEIIIEKDYSEYHAEKYSRQIQSFASLPEIELSDAVKMQKKIQKSKVIIIGLGGTGGYLALSLAMMGVEKLVIVDKDDIELSNTARQVLYDESDIGKSKIEVAEQKLKKFNKNLSVYKYEEYIMEAEDLSFLNEHADADLIVLCADTPRKTIQYIIDEAAHSLSIPWFCYGPFQHSKVKIGPLIVPRETKSYREIYPTDIFKEDSRTESINENMQSAIIDPFNGLASKIASIEVLKILTNYKRVGIINKVIEVNTDDWTIEKRSINDA